jgi:hypothetical protein
VSIATSARIAAGVIALAIAVRPVGAQQPAAVSVPRSVLERYVGEYVYPAGTIAVVRFRGDTLIRDFNGQQDVYIPLSETRFRLGSSPFVADFTIDQAGAVTQTLKAGNGPEIRLRRVEAGAVAPSVLERYVGDYQFMPRLTVMVRLRGQLLTGQQTGGPEIALMPVSETRFKVGTGDAMEVEFVADEAGAVTQVVRQGNYELRAPRTP